MGKQMNRSFWHKKRVLITGYAGFIGSNLAKEIVLSGARVTGLDTADKRKDSALSRAEIEKINCIRGNVNNFSLLKKTILKNKIEFIFHLAAETIVGDSLANPLKTFNSNIRGTWNILEAARGLGMVKAVIVASSDKAYGSHKKLPYYEDAALTGRHPYDVSKSCADLIASAYSHTYGLPVGIARCGNVYGPGDFNFSRIIPYSIYCLLTGKKVLIRSNGRFTRDYVYVEDIVKGYILLAEKMQTLGLEGEAFNFGTEDPMSVIDLVNRIYKLADRKTDYKVLNQVKYEIKHQYLSSEKAKRILNWKPEYSINEGLVKAIRWYKEYFLAKRRRGLIDISI